MKLLINIFRIVVGLLFIFSGLVKANDPHGLSYKMQEFFELWGMSQFDSWTLVFSVLMNAFEIIAGFALLLGWRIRLFSWLLLLLILFFTFLTGYTYVTGKPTNCGCFGDCIPITSKTSFLKDVVLTILIGFIFWQHNKIKPLFSKKLSAILMILVSAVSFGIQWYALTYLPLVDCLPYKKGNNITEKMKIPAGALPDSFAIRFMYERGGKQFEFAPADLPADLGSYKYVSRADKLIRKGNAEPPIRGFALTGITDQDSTAIILAQPYAIILFCEDFTTPFSAWKDDFSKLYTTAKEKNIPVYAVTSRREEAVSNFAATPFSSIPIFVCDYTAIRTAARTNPCVYLLKEGTVADKQSYKRMDKILNQLETIPAQVVPVIPKDSLQVE
ncbi:MAG TPA: BT_3928 family protein [Chitinophagaceae bacterium]|nr:BT_3928 family protein [Chitinophagaceae bacterium]